MSKYQSAEVFELLSEGKDYIEEVSSIHRLIKHHFHYEWDGKTAKFSVLVVGCNIGKHITYLKKYYSIQGIDSSNELLEIARKTNPEIQFHRSKFYRVRRHF